MSNTEHWLCEQTAKQPNNPAIQTMNGFISYQKFFDESNQVANYLLNSGVKEKDHVGILFSHSYYFFVLVNALWFIGAIPVPLNTKKTVMEIENEIVIAGIKFLIIDDSLKSRFSTLNFQNLINTSMITKDESFNNNFSINNSTFNIYNSALIIFTSGSTGNTKAVVHAFRNLHQSVLALDSFAELSPGDIWLASLPFYHIGGFMILVRSLLVGSSVVFPTSPKFGDINQARKLSSPTHISLVTPTLQYFLDNNTIPNKTLKYVFLGGGPSDTNLVLRAREKSWPIVKVYGSTETCSMITALHPNELKSNPDSVGKLLYENKIKIIRKSKDGFGEIAIQSNSLFKEYYNDQHTTNNKLKDGWYYTGDYGQIGDDGFLYIESRRDDLIISGGENITPHEVESAIKKHSLVKDVFVFGLEDKTWGQLVCAAIVPNDILEDEIKDFLKDKIASYKIPKRFFIIDSIPRNEMGKTNRTELLKLLKLG